MLRKEIAIDYQYIDILRIASIRDVHIDGFHELRIEKIVRSGEYVVDEIWKKYQGKKHGNA